MDKNIALFELLTTCTRFIDGQIPIATLRQAVDQAQASGATGQDLCALVQVVKEAIGWAESGMLLPVPMFHP